MPRRARYSCSTPRLREQAVHVNSVDRRGNERGPPPITLQNRDDGSGVSTPSSERFGTLYCLVRWFADLFRHAPSWACRHILGSVTVLATRTGSTMAPHLAWWGGFFFGPLSGLAIWLSSAPQSLARAHGQVAAIMWTVLLAFWVPFSAWIILLGGAEPILLAQVVPVVVIIALSGCIIGTIDRRALPALWCRRVALGRLFREYQGP